MTRNDFLTRALAARDEEVLAYQINIDNYTLALEHIAAMPEADRVELYPFVQDLEARLTAEKREQKKAMVMQAVVKQQLEQAA